MELCPACEGAGEFNLLTDVNTAETRKVQCARCLGERVVQKKQEWIN